MKVSILKPLPLNQIKLKRNDVKQQSMTTSTSLKKYKFKYSLTQVQVTVKIHLKIVPGFWSHTQRQQP